MIALAASLAYALVALVVARYLFRNAVKGGFKIDSASRVVLGVGFALLYSLAWPLLLLGMGVLAFLVRGANRGPT